MGIENKFADTLAQLTCAHTTAISTATLGGTEKVCYLGFCTAEPNYVDADDTSKIFVTHEIDPRPGQTNNRTYPSYARAFIGAVMVIGSGSDRTVQLNPLNKLVPSSAKSRSSVGATPVTIPYGTVTNWEAPIFGSICEEQNGWPPISHFILCNSETGNPTPHIQTSGETIYDSPEAIWYGPLSNAAPVTVEYNQVPVFKVRQFTISVSADTIPVTE